MLRCVSLLCTSACKSALSMSKCLCGASACKSALSSMSKCLVVLYLMVDLPLDQAQKRGVPGVEGTVHSEKEGSMG